MMVTLPVPACHIANDSLTCSEGCTERGGTQWVGVQPAVGGVRQTSLGCKSLRCWHCAAHAQGLCTLPGEAGICVQGLAGPTCILGPKAQASLTS